MFYMFSTTKKHTTIKALKTCFFSTSIKNIKKRFFTSMIYTTPFAGGRKCPRPDFSFKNVKSVALTACEWFPNRSALQCSVLQRLLFFVHEIYLAFFSTITCAVLDIVHASLSYNRNDHKLCLREHKPAGCHQGLKWVGAHGVADPTLFNLRGL